MKSRDNKRFEAVPPEERDYLTFAIDFCSGIIDQRPHHLEALTFIADALTALGYYEDGLSIDLRLAALKPDDPTVIYNLSCSYALTGQTATAIDTLSRSIQLGYTDPNHIMQDEDLASLREEPAFLELIEASRRRL